MTTTWRGAQLDDRTAAMMGEVARLSGPIYISPSQGSWSGAPASAGTHAGCGAIDLMNNTPDEFRTVAQIMRRVGFAAWVRDPSQSDWPWHVHGIAVQPGGKYDRGCLSSGAANQVVDYFEGRNGLASGAPDDGTRQYVGTTWETYEAPPRPPAQQKGTPLMFVTPYGRSAYRMVTGDRMIGISKDAYDALVAAGIPDAVIPVADIDQMAANLVAEGL